MNMSIKMGCLDVLLIVFIILKLVGTITWSWWLVLTPLWIMIVIYAILFCVAIIITNKSI